MGIGVGELFDKFNEFYKEYVTTKSDFTNLKERTTETLAEFKNILERFGDKINNIEIQHITSQSELKAKYDVINERLNTVTQNAILTVVRDMANNGNISPNDKTNNFNKLLEGN